MAIIPIFIPHAGCPHQCVFCNQKTISGQKTATADDVCCQIECYLKWIKPDRANQAAFYGGSFTGLSIGLQEELFKPVDALLDEGIIGSVRLSTRPDYIDVERLELLQHHNVKTVELGVQSLDDAVLALAERGHNANDVYQAVELLKAYNFNVGIQLMVGMPGQSFDSIKATVQKVLQLRPDIVRIYPLLVIKDTPLEAAYNEGAFQPLTLEEAIRQSAYVYRQMTQAGIKVIRMGLQADDELCSEGNIIAGPFHPAFGELVQSYLLHEDFTPQIQAELTQGATEIVLNCPIQLESQLRGIKNSNLQRWQDIASPVPIKIKITKDRTAPITVSGVKPSE